MQSTLNRLTTFYLDTLLNSNNNVTRWDDRIVRMKIQPNDLENDFHINIKKSEAGIITGYLLLKTKQIKYIEYKIEVILLLRKEMKKE